MHGALTHTHAAAVKYQLIYAKQEIYTAAFWHHSAPKSMGVFVVTPRNGLDVLL